MVTAPEPAVIRLLPDELRVLRGKVETHGPAVGPVGAVACAGLLWLLSLAVVAAEGLAALVPLAAHPTAHAPEPGTLGGWPPAQGWPQPDAPPPADDHGGYLPLQGRRRPP